MNYYPFHPGDYLRDTAHLEPMEDITYRRLLDLYYLSEKPIPLETDSVSRRLRIGSDLVLSVLKEFFVETPEGWRHRRCDAEIADYNARAKRARENGKAGGRPKKTQSVISGIAKETQEKANQNQNQNQINTPLAPQGGEDGELLLEPPAGQHPKSAAPTSANAIRVAAIFRRRQTTAWTPKEIRAFRAANIDEKDLADVEAYYAAEGPPDRNKNILRHDLLTLLNNWAGEVGRAQAWALKRTPAAPRSSNFFEGSSLKS